MKKYKLLKLFGMTILTMMTLIIFTFIEVAFYSYVINPNQPISVYEQHAKFSAPIVAGLGGFAIFFLVARYWKKKNYSNLLTLVLLFPLIYTTFDLIILLIEGSAQWQSFIFIFILASGAKFLGSCLGYRIG